MGSFLVSTKSKALENVHHMHKFRKLLVYFKTDASDTEKDGRYA
jgi:hypothetical protein